MQNSQQKDKENSRGPFANSNTVLSHQSMQIKNHKSKAPLASTPLEALMMQQKSARDSKRGNMIPPSAFTNCTNTMGHQKNSGGLPQNVMIDDRQPTLLLKRDQITPRGTNMQSMELQR